jgi:hypothetical protein
MPELIAELRTDVRGDTTELVRDVFIVGSRTWVVGFAGRQYFYYVTTEIPGLELQMDWLEEMGLLKDSRTGNVPHYRLSPDFAAWLRDGDVIDA